MAWSLQLTSHNDIFKLPYPIASSLATLCYFCSSFLHSQSHCINSWVCASKQEPASGAELVHAAWLDHKPMVRVVCALRAVVCMMLIGSGPSTGDHPPFQAGVVGSDGVSAVQPPTEDAPGQCIHLCLQQWHSKSLSVMLLDTSSL